MRGVLLCVMLVAVSGCADTALETDGEEPQAQDPGSSATDAAAGNETVRPLSGRLVATVGNTTFWTGVPFNVTLDYVDDNATDASNFSWQATFRNETVNGAEAPSFNGTGLPATFAANLSLLGNVTMTATAMHGNHTVALEPLMLVVERIQEELGDPCADPGDGLEVLEDGQTISVTVGQDEWVHYRVCVPTADGALTVDQGAPSDEVCVPIPAVGSICNTDADLYVRAGEQPTAGDYDCRPYLAGSEESCALTGLDAGWVYVSSHGYSGPVDITLQATLG